jgi:hypothetical protein
METINIDTRGTLMGGSGRMLTHNSGNINNDYDDNENPVMY